MPRSGRLLGQVCREAERSGTSRDGQAPHTSPRHGAGDDFGTVAALDEPLVRCGAFFGDSPQYRAHSGTGMRGQPLSDLRVTDPLLYPPTGLFDDLDPVIGPH